MMKVLHVNAGLESGGGLFHIINLLTAARVRGEDFRLLTFAEGPVAKAARNHNIPVDVLDISSRYSLDLPKRLKQYLNENNFEIVHTHGPRANLIMSLIHNKVNAKWAITVHSDPLKDFEGRGVVGKVFEKLNVRSLKKADRLLAITERFSNILQSKLQISKSKISVIYNGIFFNDKEDEHRTHQEFNLINVARMEPVKGQKLLLEAIKQVNIPELRLHFVGDGSERDNLEELVIKLGLESQVLFHGFLNHDEINQVYQTTDLAVLTSFSESFPLVLLEAADNFVPLLSTDVGDMYKMIPDFEHGIVVPIGDVNAIANGIKKAYNQGSSKREAMAVREKDYLQNNFSVFNQLEDVKNIYQLMLTKK